MSPFARRRGERAREAFEAAGIELRSHPGLNAVDVSGDRDRAGQALHRLLALSPQVAAGRRAAACSRRRENCPRCRRSSPKGRLPSLEALGLSQEVAEPAPGGEAAARRALDRFLDGPVARVHRDPRRARRRPDLAALAVPALRLRSRSARVEERLPRGAGPDAFRRQLCWRDFYHHVLHHFPRNARSEFQQRYRGKIKWSYAREALRGVVRGPHRLSARRRRRCASCAARAGCTTAPGSSSARS